jgi:dihydroorotate dehydrogenase (fumarate)
MTTFCGTELKSCLMNAAGCMSTNKEQLDTLSTRCGMVVSKSATVEAQKGNALPRLYIDDKVCINNMGLPNYGFDYYNHIKLPNYILSIYPKTTSELMYMLKKSFVNMIEVNLSCPNVNATLHLEPFLKVIKEYSGNGEEHRMVGIKMPPVYDNSYVNISKLLLDNNINFITCSNTIANCLVVDTNKEETVIYPNQGMGSMSFKHVSLSNVYNFHKLLKDKIDIIGVGGIESGKDVFEYILCGATCVQIGATLLREGTKCFERIEKEFNSILHQKGYKSINDFKGKIKVAKL